MGDLSSVKDHVALVTGGTQGIGLACAQRLLAQGAKVAILGRDASAGAQAMTDLKQISPHIAFIQADCTQKSDVIHAVNGVKRLWGTIHILVNCAGGFLAKPKLENLSEDDWQQGLQWNLTSSFLSVQAVVPIMKQNAYGRIVNVSSVAGRAGVITAPIDYSASKAALTVMTQRLALELAPLGITANVVAPGTTETPRVLGLGAQRIEDITTRIPVGRLGKPEEIAHAIFYFCTPGSGFTTGAVLDVNGGIWTGA
jgi:NAD(P)-dependent dehydrogenase (short-subunit alcohol dehydrogenase family)